MAVPEKEEELLSEMRGSEETADHGNGGPSAAEAPVVYTEQADRKDMNKSKPDQSFNPTTRHEEVLQSESTEPVQALLAD